MEKNKIRRIYVLLSILILTAVHVPAKVFAQDYVLIPHDTPADVIEIIDGESIKVRLNNTNEIALVRLVGIDAKGYTESMIYLNNTILGKKVLLSFEASVPRVVNNRWNNMHVSCDGISINTKLVSLGYAAVSSNYTGSYIFETLNRYEESAQKAGLGLWQVDDKYSYFYNYSRGGKYSYQYSGDGVNINTASISGFRGNLEDVPDSVIRNIISYREDNPFNHIGEIKFVPGFTWDMFEDNRDNLVVCTNIARASEDELLTLGNITQREVDRLIAYREKYSFSGIEDLYDEGIISRSSFRAIENFISLYDTSEIDVAVPDIEVDINTADVDDFVEIGISRSSAERIVEYRTGYSYKTLGELMDLPGVRFSQKEINSYADNLLIDNAYSMININFATTDELIDMGFTSSEASKIRNKRKSMKCSADIPVDVSYYHDQISLYTNINTASDSELESLGFSTSTIRDIDSYRQDQPFGSDTEVRDFFYDLDEYNVYTNARSFIVVR